MATGLGFRIGAIHAYVSVDEDNEEGIIGAMGADGTWVPLIAADEERLRLLRDVAERTAKATGREVRLVKFTTREDVEVIAP